MVIINTRQILIELQKIMIEKGIKKKELSDKICLSSSALTSRGKKELPTHVQLHMNEVNGLSKDSIVLLEQIKTIDKKRIKERIGKLSDEEISEVKEALMISVAI